MYVHPRILIALFILFGWLVLRPNPHPNPMTAIHDAVYFKHGICYPRKDVVFFSYNHTENVCGVVNTMKQCQDQQIELEYHMTNFERENPPYWLDIDGCVPEMGWMLCEKGMKCPYHQNFTSCTPSLKTHAYFKDCSQLYNLFFQ